MQLPAGAQPHPFDIRCFHVGRRPHVHVAGRAVDDDGVAGVGDARGIGDLAHGGNAKRPGDDCHMRIGSAFLEHEAAQTLAIVVEQRRRPHGAGHENGIFRQPVARRRVVLAEQLVHQPVGELIEVMQAFAQIRVGCAQHARAGVRLHALDRGFGGQPGGHGFFQPVHPPAVVGEHAIGFEHIAVLPAVGDLAALEQHVEIRPHGLDRCFEPLQLFRYIVGDEIGDDYARLVQHHVTERDAVVERHAGELQRAAGGGLGAGLCDGRQFARGDHLGEHHRRGLQRLLFLLGVGATRPVLHHQHAERIAGAQDRHAQEGMVNLFAGLLAVREGRMVLGFRQVDRIGFARDQADQAFVRTQYGLVHGLLVEAFGGVQFERAVHAQYVDRADLRHHVGSDQHHDLVQALLRADLLRHHLAKPAQQHARTAERATHDVIPRASPSGRGLLARGSTKVRKWYPPGPGVRSGYNPSSRIANAAWPGQAKAFRTPPYQA